MILRISLIVVMVFIQLGCSNELSGTSPMVLTSVVPDQCIEQYGAISKLLSDRFHASSRVIPLNYRYKPFITINNVLVIEYVGDKEDVEAVLNGWLGDCGSRGKTVIDTSKNGWGRQAELVISNQMSDSSSTVLYGEFTKGRLTLFY